MNLLSKLKETALSVVPVMVIVLILGFFTGAMTSTQLIQFSMGGIMLTVGLTIFLLGVDLGIQPIGERSGAELTKKRNLPLLVCVAFVIGFLVTIAEPDIQVFGDQVRGIFPAVNKWLFVIIIAFGVGLFIMTGLTRTIFQISLKITMLVLYVIVFAVSVFVPDSFFAIAFDSGGATTGPMTVPFILALGLGVCSVRSGGSKEGFGLTGIVSVGPVLAVLIYGMVFSKMGLLNVTEEASISEIQTAEAFGVFSLLHEEFLPVLKEATLSILPIVLLFLVFQVTLLKMTKRQFVRIIIGLVYSYIGLIVFLWGVKSGFMQGGEILGEFLGINAAQNGGWWLVLLVGTGLALGAIVVCAEPAVWVLTEQVEQASGGAVKRKYMLIFLAVGTALAIGITLLRAVMGFNLRFVLIPCYAIALLLMIFSPNMFTGIAFDSGGVASGPLTSTFILSFTLSAAGSGNGTDAFGVIALVATMPIIAIQLLGIIFKKKMNIEPRKGGDAK